MINCTTVREKMQELLPKELFADLVSPGNEEFTAYKQLKALRYAQLREKEGLRAIEAGLKAEIKLQEYTGTSSYSQLSRVNADRETELFKRVFETVYAKLSSPQGLRNIPLNQGLLKVLDSTAVRLCLKLYPWAKYRAKTGAVKSHTLYELAAGCPEAFVLTDGLTHDKTQRSKFVAEPGVTQLFDRAYLDHLEFDYSCDNGLFFVSRLKKKAVFEVVNFKPVKEVSPVLSDKTVILGSHKARMKNKVRLVEVVASSKGEVFYLVTNRFDLTAEEIADIYRLRWSIETFFRGLKQHLKSKKFYSTSFNGILLQLYTALLLYCLLKLLHVLPCAKFDFLKRYRLIADGLFNSREQLLKCLTPARPPPKQKRWDNDWKKHYNEVLKLYNVKDSFR